jgi:hypothetical protein
MIPEDNHSSKKAGGYPKNVRVLILRRREFMLTSSHKKFLFGDT